MSMVLNINDEQGIEILHFIFEREFKPPFRKDEIDRYGDCLYYNRDNKIIGGVYFSSNFSINVPLRNDIGSKICQVFGFSYDTWDWWFAIKPRLKSWLEEQLNIEISRIL